MNDKLLQLISCILNINYIPIDANQKWMKYKHLFGGICIIILGVMFSLNLLFVPMILLEFDLNNTDEIVFNFFFLIFILSLSLFGVGLIVYGSYYMKGSFISKNRFQIWQNSGEEFKENTWKTPTRDMCKYPDNHKTTISVQSSTVVKQIDISSIDHMDGHKFEYFCADLLKNNGFVNVSVTPGSGDMGVDILAEKEGVKYAVQCKNYESSLGNKPIQEITAGKNYYKCHVGVVMTNSHFTPGAIELANANGILLWDRSVVQKMML